MLALEFHPLVERDVTAGATWYERRETGLGFRFAEEANSIFERLPHDALLYAIRFDDIRRLNLPSFPYGVFYFVDGQAVVVLAVFHGVRDFQAVIEERRAIYPQ